MLMLTCQMEIIHVEMQTHAWGILKWNPRGNGGKNVEERQRRSTGGYSWCAGTCQSEKCVSIIAKKYMSSYEQREKKYSE